MLEAGFPEGVFRNLLLKTEDIVNVINDGRVQGASVTGSVRACSCTGTPAPIDALSQCGVRFEDYWLDQILPRPYSRISAIPDSGSICFCMCWGLSMRMTSHVGRTYASIRCPP